MTNSTKIIIPYCELRSSLLTDFSKGKVDFENLKWNYGIEFSTHDLFPKLKIILRTGNLTGTGSLPQYNSFSSPQSYFGEINWTSNKIVKKLSINALYKSNNKNESGTFTSTALIKLKSFNKATLTFSNTAGVYPYDKRKFTSWFNEEKFYHEGRHVCFSNQISLVANGNSTVFIVNTYQSPFGDFLNTWQTKNTLKLKDFTFDFDAFYNANDEVLTNADKKIKPLLQLDFGGQYKFFTGTKNPYAITAGINSQTDINLAQKNHTMKTQGNIYYSGGAAKGFFKTELNFKLTNEADGIKTDFSGGSIESSNSFYIYDFTPTITAKFSFTPDSKKTKWTYTEKIGINFEYEESGKNITFTNKNSISFTQKTGDSKNKIAFTSSLSAKFVFRFCSLLFHLEFQV
ncbi:MAG: hypothetical protein J5687_03880 [Treponema sp.]|nr:hypothetical protein [Treponema sp.]